MGGCNTGVLSFSRNVIYIYAYGEVVITNTHWHPV